MTGSRNLGVIVTASLAGLLFGFDTVVISGVTESVGKVFQLAPGSDRRGTASASTSSAAAAASSHGEPSTRCSVAITAAPT